MEPSNLASQSNAESEINFPIVFSYPKESNPSGAFMMIFTTIFGIIMVYLFVKALFTITDLSSEIFCWVFLLLFSFGVLLNLCSVITARKISIYENFIQKKYVFLPFLNKKYNPEECTGYYTFSKQTVVPRGGRTSFFMPTKYSGNNGVILKFKNQSTLKIFEFVGINSNYESGKIHILQNLLNKKNIQYFPTNESF